MMNCQWASSSEISKDSKLMDFVVKLSDFVLKMLRILDFAAGVLEDR